MYLIVSDNMGRLNKKLSKKVPKRSNGLSSAAAKALASMKDVMELHTGVRESPETPTSNFISISKVFENEKTLTTLTSNEESNQVSSKQRRRLIEKTAGKVVKGGHQIKYSV